MSECVCPESLPLPVCLIYSCGSFCIYHMVGSVGIRAKIKAHPMTNIRTQYVTNDCHTIYGFKAKKFVQLRSLNSGLWGLLPQCLLHVADLPKAFWYSNPLVRKGTCIRGLLVLGAQFYIPRGWKENTYSRSPQPSQLHSKTTLICILELPGL